jgi:hypothetical protein
MKTEWKPGAPPFDFERWDSTVDARSGFLLTFESLKKSAQAELERGTLGRL